MFLFKSCCCACSLRTGTLMIGWLSLFLRICLLFFLIGSSIMLKKHGLAIRNAQNDARGLNGEVERPGEYFYHDEKLDYLDTWLNESGVSFKNESEIDEGYIAAAIGYLNFDTLKYHASNLLFLDPVSNDTDPYIDQSNARHRRQVFVQETDPLAEYYTFAVFLGSMIVTCISIVTSILLIVGAFKGCIRLLLPWITSELLTIVLNVIIIISNLSGCYDGKREIVLTHSFVIGLYIYMLLVVMSHCKELEQNKKKNNAMAISSS